MTYELAIAICKKLNDPHTEDVLYEREILAAVEKILSMATINAVPKEALLNIVRWFFVNCTVEEKPMTNADKIRAMTDEELAAYLPDHRLGAKFDPENPYHVKFMDWLKQEAQDGK